MATSVVVLAAVSQACGREPPACDRLIDRATSACADLTTGNLTLLAGTLKSRAENSTAAASVDGARIIVRAANQCLDAAGAPSRSEETTPEHVTALRDAMIAAMDSEHGRSWKRHFDCTTAREFVDRACADADVALRAIEEEIFSGHEESILEYGSIAHSVAATCLGTVDVHAMNALAGEYNELALAFSAAPRDSARAEVRRNAARIVATMRRHVQASHKQSAR